MTFEPIGLVTVLAGMACFVFGPAVSLVVFTCFTLLGAAAATILTALSGANISPSHFLLMFLVADLVLRPGLLRHGLHGFRFPSPGFWLLLTAAYGIAATLIMPRLFAGATYVFSPARSESGGVSLVLAVPLAPTGANLTQSIYFVSGVVCFFLFYTYAGRQDAARQIVRALSICGVLNLAFAGIDLATYYTGTAEALAFIRNSSYRLLDDVETAGLKRIVGSFTEAGSFAYTTVALLMFHLRLWSEGIASGRTGPIALLSMIAVLFATSSTGYVGLAVVLAVQLGSAGYRFLRGRATGNTIVLLGIAPVICAVLVAGVLLTPNLRAGVGDLIDVTLFNKLSSESGIERGAWNRQAIGVFRDTLWLGAGIGSLRASSWLVAVPASIGVVGAFLYGSFMLGIFGGRNEGDRTMRAVRAAARDACLVQLVAASISGAFIDLGLFFFLFAGIACGLRPAASTGAAPVAAPGGPGRPGGGRTPWTGPRIAGPQVAGPLEESPVVGPFGRPLRAVP